MGKKRYTIKTSCPQCGCTDLTVLSPEEIKKKYGDAPNVDMECNACVLKYSTDMEKACPEWDKECKMKR